jgi:hypothetical protein
MSYKSGNIFFYFAAVVLLLLACALPEITKESAAFSAPETNDNPIKSPAPFKWKQIKTKNSPLHGFGKMTFDENRNVYVLIQNESTKTTTWEFDGTDWSKKSQKIYLFRMTICRVKCYFTMQVQKMYKWRL